MKDKVFYFPITKIRSPYSNLAIEEGIALNLVKFGLIGGIRLWKNPECIVLGLSENPNLTIEESVITNFKNNITNKTLTKHKIDDFTYITRRASGGGTVYQNSTDNVNYSIYISLEKRPELFSVKDSYEALLGLVMKALKKQSISVSSKGKSDIAVLENGMIKKISGNAQFRKKNCIVQHGTLILDPALIKKVTGILLHPPEEPEYRKERSHNDFLTSLPNDFALDQFETDFFDTLLSYLGLENPANKEEFSFFGRGFSSFRRSVLKESEIIRKRKYESLSYILNREIPT
ncbi:MAG: lipoate--protein ligase family protein [Leptospira sp.]|nr:lipoate--protein ligase family protein [Leptospira sp.]